MVKSIKQYELIPPVKTSFKSRCHRKCLMVKNNAGNILNSCIDFYKKKTIIIKINKIYIFEIKKSVKTQRCQIHFTLNFSGENTVLLYC